MVPVRNIDSQRVVHGLVDLPTALTSIASRFARLCGIALLLIAPWEQSALRSQSKSVAITNVTVIDATGGPPRSNVTVVVKGERIDAVGGTGSLTVPEGADVIDGTGKFLIPGLWDMHVHSGGYQDGRTQLPRLVAYGITGVRDMASTVDDVLRLRRETADGTIVGPQMIVAGPILQGPLPFRLPPLVRTVTDQDAKQVVDELRAKGVDFIKVGDTITREAYFSIAEETKRVGLPFAGHLPVSVSASEAARAGQRSIEHFGSAGFRGVLIACSGAEAELSAYVQEALATARAGGALPDTRVDRAEFTNRLVNTYDPRKAAALFSLFVSTGTWQVPTLVAIRGAWHEQRAGLNADDAAASDRAATQTLEMFGQMRRAGVRVLAGSDTPIGTGVPPLHDELVALVGAGVSPMEALQAATRGPAEFLGRLRDEGTIEAGKKANLVLLDANPLADIANTRRVAAVLLAGHVFDAGALQKMR
jgi:imidazolonepropionase-like amidohydrolase